MKISNQKMVPVRKYRNRTLSLRQTCLVAMLLLAGRAGAQTGFDTTRTTIVTIDSFVDSQEIIEDEPEEEGADSFQILGTMADTGLTRSRALPDSFLRRMRGNNDFWYANHSFAKEKQQEKEKVARTSPQPFFTKKWFRVLVWIVIIGGFVSVMIWYLVSSNIRLFERKNPPLPGPEEDVQLTEDIYHINFQEQINQAIQRKDFRFAIRMMFLSTLRELSDRNIIQYNEKRTNLDYLMQIRESEHYRDFFQLTRNYEYTWYGKFDPGESGFALIKSSFDNFKKRLY